jgi:dTDP-4-dehydrorhamnose 3,5-epimerase
VIIRELRFGCLEIIPKTHRDSRGSTTEWFRWDKLHDEAGLGFFAVQANLAVSLPYVLRGIHYSIPGQSKYVLCAKGAVKDVLVDLRMGSKTFGQWELVHLSDALPRAIYVPPYVGHGYVSLRDTVMVYMTNATYNPAHDRGVNPMDPGLNIEWGVEDPLMSTKDTEAPSLNKLFLDGLLPRNEE